MCDVTKSQLTSFLPRITESIQKSAFVAIDTEFTGLQVGFQDKLSLFDSNSERYSKLKIHAEQFIICQIGIAAFIKDDSANHYNAHTYNFYICPHSTGIIDSHFLWQTSGLEFLCQHNFDFNKFAYEGISYLNSKEEAELRSNLKDACLFKGIKRDTNERTIQLSCSSVAKWLSSLPVDGDEMTLQVDKCVADYTVHKEVRLNFSEVWTFHGRTSEVIVKKVSADERRELESVSDNLDDRLIDDLLGFTRVFQLLVSCKKPIVGHNFLVDLLLIYNQFYKPLPKTHDHFKSEILDLFPKIFDTKYIACTLRKQFVESGVLESSVLDELYAALDSDRGRFVVLHSPVISHDKEFTKYVNASHSHEAGYDAYLTGYVFLRIAHMHFLHGKSVDEQCPVAFNRLLRNMEAFKNKLHLMRANLSFVDLQSPDPKAKCSKWLIVRSKCGGAVSTSEITEMCSQFGSVDVKLLGDYALVAVTNFRSLRELRSFLSELNDFEISTYNPLRHLQWARRLLWSCAVVSTVLGTKLAAVALSRII